ncbi:hypothetical protein [Paenibacillus sp. sgz500958]|uniref:hypothetical protein n=1 Tax=Paenibacillus sp. sgz500958 TaxID=3242475 RepID=UPI0036D35E41
MTNNPMESNKDKQLTDTAWARMQEKLAMEPMNSVWSTWNQQGIEDEAMEHKVNSVNYSDSQKQGQDTSSSGNDQASIRGTVHTPSRSRRKMSRGRKWATAAAGIAVFAAILATPVGNTAMASLLNQFRMQDVTVVKEDDLRDLFYQVTEDGDMKESINKFGTFTYTSGTSHRDLTPDQIPGILGYAPISSLLNEKGNNINVESSQEITLNLKVDEVNKAMKRLGAEKLLPQSVDGKPITLAIPASVNYQLTPDGNHWADLTQMNIPVLTVDPSIKVEEALEAVMNFPLLPDHLKDSLKQSRILSGEIPMPLITGGHSEQLIVGNTEVILETHDYSQEFVSYEATWVQDGQLFRFNGGSLYADKDKFMAKLQELISG